MPFPRRAPTRQRPIRARLGSRLLRGAPAAPPTLTAPSVVGTPQAFAFTANPTTVTYTGGGTGTNLVDVLCVNSDATVATPAGWTAGPSRVSSQGSYIFWRAGGATTAAIVAGPANSDAFWVRLQDCSGIDSGASTTAGVDGSAGTSTPAVTSGALSTATELVVAFAALHNVTTAPTGYTWSSGYTGQTSGNQSTGIAAVAGSVAVKTPAGTAAESPSVSWTNNASDRYILVTAFSGAVVADSSATATPSTVPATAAISSATFSSQATAAPTTVAAAAAVPAPTVVVPFNGATPATVTGRAVFNPPTLTTTSGGAGLTPTVRGTGTAYLSAATDTSATVQLPANTTSGWQTGDLLLLPVTLKASTSNIAAPAGWSTVVANFNQAASASGHMALFGKIAGGSESNPVVGVDAGTGGRFAAEIIAVKDHGLATVADLVAASDVNTASASTSIVAPTVTPGDDHSLLLTFHGGSTTATGTTYTVTPPGSGAEVLDICTAVAASTNSGLEVSSQALTAATATGTRTATATVAVAAQGVSLAVNGTAGAATSNVTVGVLTVQATSAVPPPAPPGGATVTPSTVAAVAAVGAATVSGAGVGTVVHLFAGGSTTSQIVVTPKVSGAATTIRLKVSTAADLSSPAFSSAVTPDANGYARLVCTGLTAGTNYYYQVESGGGTIGAVGRCRTAPSGASSFSFAFGSCAMDDAQPASWARAKARNPDLCVINGDFPYIDVTTNNQASIRADREATLLFTGVQSMVSGTATYYTWSDHDFGGNDSDTNSASKPASQAVYRQQIPYPTLEVSDAIYHTFVWGRCRFILTDNRSFKSPNTDADTSAKTVLGSAQKTWFKNLISSATEPVIFWVNEQPWIGPASTPDDDWFAYNTERQELAAHIAATGKEVVILAGDMHAVAADDGTNSPGGLAVMHGAPWRNSASIKGGPYTSGPYPASGTAFVEQYGYVQVTDTGSAVTVAFNGYDDTNTSRVSLTLTTAQATAATVAAVATVGAPTVGQGTLPAPATVAAAAAVAQPVVKTGAKVGRAVLWADEFNGAAGTAPSDLNWRLSLFEENGRDNAWVRDIRCAQHLGDGTLRVTAIKEVSGTRQYISARLVNQDVRPDLFPGAVAYYQKYGRFEVRCKIPAGSGLWPAPLWTMGPFDTTPGGWPECGEIDVEESINAATTAFGHLHMPDGAGGDYGPQGMAATGTWADGQWHVFAVEHTPGRMEWFADGTSRGVLTRASAEAAGAVWVFDDIAQSPIIDLAVGGSWAGASDGSWTTKSMDVDYVRIFEWNGAELATVRGTATIGAATAQTGAKPAPGTVAAVASIGAPQVLTGNAPTPTTVAATATIGAATPAAGALAAPATVQAVSAVGTTTVRLSAAITPAAVAAVAAVGAPAVSGTGNVAPATVAATAVVGAPQVLTGNVPTPATVQAVAAVAAPTIAAGARPAPATVAGTAAVGVSTPTTGASAAPATVAATTGIGTAAVQVKPTPDTVQATTTIPAPAVGGSTIAAPGTVAGTAAVGATVVRGSVAVSPATVAGLATIAATTVLTSMRVSPATVAGSVTIGGSAFVPATIAPSTVAGVAAVGVPTVATVAVASAATVAARAAVPQPVVQIRITPRPFTGRTTRPSAGITYRP